jgi:uncharacterized protein YjbI with pentapeptide repeats
LARLPRRRSVSHKAKLWPLLLPALTIISSSLAVRKEPLTKGRSVMANKKQVAQLKQGVEAWNQWRRENPKIRPDLSRAVLIRATLSGADLRRTNLIDADLSYADLCGAQMMGAKLREATLRGAELRKADLRRADLRQADLFGANLSGADLSQASLSGADLDCVNLRGTGLNAAVLSRLAHSHNWGAAVRPGVSGALTVP